MAEPTPRELRDKAVCANFKTGQFFDISNAGRAVDAAIKAAVAAERAKERAKCARIARSITPVENMQEAIAEAIERGKEP